MGSGDVYPVTPLGKIFGPIIVVLGIGIFALPAGIIASGFIEEDQTRKKKLNTFPHWGKDLSEHSGPKIDRNNCRAWGKTGTRQDSA